MSGVIASILSMARQQRGAEAAEFEADEFITPACSLARVADYGKALQPSCRWRFLRGSPWTRDMLEDAADRWGDPLSRDDLLDIQAGAYLFEQREQALRFYLSRWSEDHPRRMAELTAVHRQCAD